MVAKSAAKIAKTTKLTKEVLFQEVLNSVGDCSMGTKAQICEDIHTVSHCYGLTEPIIVFCYLKLFEEKRVKDLKFLESFEANRIGIVSEYLKEYYNSIEYIQLKFWQEK